MFRKTVRSIAIGIVLAVAVSAVVSVYMAIRGRYVAIGLVQYLFPGDDWCMGVGAIDVLKSAKWLSVRYQKVAGNEMVYDWCGIFVDFLIRIPLYSILLVTLSIYLANKRDKIS